MKSQEFRDYFDTYGYAGPFPTLTSGDFKKLQAKVRADHSYGLGLLRLALFKLGITGRDPIYDRKAHVESELAYKASTDPEILIRVEQLLGHELILWMSQVICRWPGHGGVDWHVDQINANVEGVHVSIALSDMNIKNGCLQVIPGTHKYDVDLNALAKNGDCDLSDAHSMARLADKIAPENAPHKLVSMELKAGEFFFTRGGLWHGVVTNHSLGTRMAMITRFMKPEFKDRVDHPQVAVDW
jgi:ectoine hydroxylase-related dioxygenase (phytanoyl-CoA dioxygenase family)